MSDFTLSLRRELALEFKKRRQYLNLTQQALAKKANLSQSIIAKFEQHQIDPTYSTILKIEHTLSSLEKISQRVAEKIMITDIISIEQSKTLKDALLLMRKHDFSQLFITKQKQIIGTLYETDILDAITQDNELSKTKITAYVQMLPPIIAPQYPIAKLAPFFSNTKTQVLLVGDQTKIVGLITKSDMFKPA